MHRHPAVAGHFYAGTAEGLRRQVGGFVARDQKRIKAIGILCPHAGLMYSGAVAGAVYSRIELPDIFVLIGPNHTGLGQPVSLMPEGTWETPLGKVGIDEALASAILDRSPRIHADSLAHLREHSLEVQLPFIQYFRKEFSIVPIQMMDTRLDTCIEVGRAVASAIQDRTKAREQGATAEPADNILIVASSDMSHYEPAAIARERDFKAIDRIIRLDAEGLYRTVHESGITMCGFGPAVAMLSACRILGARNAELVKYSNSGEVSGDYDQVVGYAGVVVF